MAKINIEKEAQIVAKRVIQDLRDNGVFIGRWIPVTERLPELYTFVYATCHSLVDDREDWVIETCYVQIPKEYNSRRFSDWGNIPMLNNGEAKVIAWMERDIPEPYMAESEEV